MSSNATISLSDTDTLIWTSPFSDALLGLSSAQAQRVYICNVVATFSTLTAIVYTYLYRNIRFDEYGPTFSCSTNRTVYAMLVMRLLSLITRLFSNLTVMQATFATCIQSEIEIILMDALTKHEWIPSLWLIIGTAVVWMIMSTWTYSVALYRVVRIFMDTLVCIVAWKVYRKAVPSECFARSEMRRISEPNVSLGRRTSVTGITIEASEIQGATFQIRKANHDIQAYSWLTRASIVYLISESVCITVPTYITAIISPLIAVLSLPMYMQFFRFSDTPTHTTLEDKQFVLTLFVCACVSLVCTACGMHYQGFV